MKNFTNPVVGWIPIINVARLCMSKGLMFFVILLMSSLYMEAQTLPGTYTTSWAGNSFAPANNDYNFIQYEANSMFVETDGTIYTNGYFDEAGKEMGIYKDGLPIGKIPNSHGYSDGGSIITNGTYIWASVQEGRVVRYNKSNLLPAAADFLVSNTSTVLSQNIVGGLALVGSELFASDYTGNKIKVYSALNDGVLLRSWTVAKPLTMATDASGNIWVISYDLSKWGATRSIANIYCYSTTGTLLKTLTMPSDVEAKYIAINKASNELFVTDIGDNMQIRIYNNINTTPTLVQSFGTQGGILSGIKGLVAPLKLNVPNLVGLDGSGNIIVWANGNNTDIPTADGSDAWGACVESYTRAGVRNWQMLGLEFVDMGTFDPATDGADLYTKHEHFTMDYSKPDGQQWTWKGWTVDRKKYKGDARLFNSSSSHLAPTLMKRINGKLFMYMTSMTSDGWWVYRFDNTNEGEIAIPCGNVTPWENLWVDTNGNGNVDAGENPSPLSIPQGEEVFGRNVDDNGTIWFARTTGGIYKYPVQSINSFGVPVYSPTAAQIVAMPAPFTDLRRINYDAATDAMYLTGYTSALRNSNGDWGPAGRVLARYNNWSTGNRTAAYTINIPYNITTNISTTSFIVEKDYIFVVGYASKGKVTVYNASTGALAGEMIPGANVGGIDRTGACDLRNSVAAFKKSTGEYLVTVEDDLFEKVLIYRWSPGASNVAVSSVSISPASVSLTVAGTQQLTATVLPSNATNKNVTWSSSNTAIATVNPSGLVTAVGAGSATITVTSQDGAKTATSAITVTASTSSTTIIDNMAAGWTWSGFTVDPCSTCFGGSAHSSATRNHSGQYTFTGTKLEAYCETYYGAGSLEIFIDNVSKGIFSQDVTPYSGGVLFATISNLTQGSHTVKFVQKARIRAGIDYLRITNSSSAVAMISSVVEIETSLYRLSVYPNPSNTGSVTIDFNGDLNEETAEVVIIDLMGRIVYQSGKLSHVSKLSVSTQGYSNGSYIVKVSKGKERISRILIIGQ